ncbi:MAG: homocysteine biosynthesis protein [Candidatus Wallbacteria bacterium]|nr:homocysteine biosynthesis protein [Candidatus Wallbacteria bacterium]
MAKSIEEINDKIAKKTVKVLTAEEMTRLVAETGPEKAAAQVDVVTTGTFGAMCSSGMWFNTGHSDPPIKMTKVWLNDVEAYTGLAAVDGYIGATQMSETRGMKYGGAHVIEDLINGKPVILRAVAYGTDCYPRKEIVTEITLADLNQALMFNPRNAYQRYNAAANTGAKTLYTYMGKLLPSVQNATYSGAGELSPINNDPDFRTIGIGTRIFLNGARGHIVGSGTQHNPDTGFSTLMVQGNVKEMLTEYVRAAVFKNYGCTLYVGIGVPIPVLDADIAKRTGIANRDLTVDVLDYSKPTRNRPALGKVTYEELKSGNVIIDGKKVRTAPISSYAKAKKIAGTLKQWIEKGEFLLSQTSERLSKKSVYKPMIQQEPAGFSSPRTIDITGALKDKVSKDNRLCVECGLCIGVCSNGAYTRDPDWHIHLDSSRCVSCGQCRDICPFDAIALKEGEVCVKNC